jgi:hypothetical protein
VKWLTVMQIIVQIVDHHLPSFFCLRRVTQV